MSNNNIPSNNPTQLADAWRRHLDGSGESPGGANLDELFAPFSQEELAGTLSAQSTGGAGLTTTGTNDDPTSLIQWETGYPTGAELEALVGPTVPFPPTTSDGTHPVGSLKVKDGVITTAGGFKIEQLGQFEWRITGPDGKHTRIWGDPHVDEGDGGKWDFKRNSTFVLADGTQIHCKTAPWGDKGMTVTQELEIISGDDRVMVTDIDKGKGKVGQVTQDGFERAGNNYDDVFVMGMESDDWALKGREVIGHERGGEKHKTGDRLLLGYRDWNVDQNRFNKGVGGWGEQGGETWTRWLELIGEVAPAQNPVAYNPYAGTEPFGLSGLSGLNGGGSQTPTTTSYSPTRHADILNENFRYLDNMLKIFGELSSLRDDVLSGRNISTYRP